MGSAQWKVEEHIEAAPDVVYAWMTDFRPDDHDSEAYKRGAGIDPTKKQKPSTRTILSREGDTVRIRDEWGGSTYEQTLTLDRVARTVRIQGGMGYEALWRAAPEGSGTRLSVHGRMGRGILGSLMKLFEGNMQKSMESDFRGHAEELRESLKAKAR